MDLTRPQGTLKFKKLTDEAKDAQWFLETFKELSKDVKRGNLRCYAICAVVGGTVKMRLKTGSQTTITDVDRLIADLDEARTRLVNFRMNRSEYL